MTIDESLARGLTKRQHRELKDKIRTLQRATRERKGAALKQTRREMRRVFGDMILHELVTGQKKQSSIIWILLYPIENDQYFIMGGAANWKQPEPRFFNLMVLSLHAMQRLKQKDVDLKVELSTAMLNLISACAAVDDITDSSREAALEACGKEGFELYTRTGRLPLVWTDEDHLLAATWIADSWSSPVRQEFIAREREENLVFCTREFDAS